MSKDLRLPAVTLSERHWTSRSGARQRYLSATPADLACLELTLPSGLAARAERAALALSVTAAHPDLTRLARLLEASASSRIEGVGAPLPDVLLAGLGRRVCVDAALVHGADRATGHLLEHGPHADALLAAHRMLLAGDPSWDGRAGVYRDGLVWIGSPWSTPPTAAYVAPEAALVPGAMDDLFAFCARDDLPALVQAAIAHAQFETIHPFGDGNGRVGRALVAGVLRAAGIEAGASAPLSLLLAHDKRRYVDALRTYRDGDASAIVELYADTADTAAACVGHLARALEVVRAHDRGALASQARPDAVAWRVLPLLYASPVIDTAYLKAALGLHDSAAHRAVAHLTQAGLLRQVTTGRRNRAWEHPGVLAALAAARTLFRP